MADITDIRLGLPSGEAAARAERIAKDLLRLDYALSAQDKPAWLPEDLRGMTLSRAYSLYGERASAYDPTIEHPHCALSRIHHEGAALFIDRCGDLVRGFLMTSGKAFFPQLCVTLSQALPQTPFTAFCRYEMTVTGGVTLSVLNFDGKIFRAKEMYVEWPKEEDDWSDADVSDYAVGPDGALSLI